MSSSLVIIDPNNIRKMKDEVINKRIEDELDKHFPKGDKARGRALVLNAVANIEIEKAKAQIIKEVEKIIDKELPYTLCYGLKQNLTKESIKQFKKIFDSLIIQQIKKLGEKK